MIEFQQVSKHHHGQVAVDRLSLHIRAGELLVLIGPSGSGKSTTLKMINRLVEHDSGKILFAGEPIRRLRPEDLRRRMGYAIQSIGLFPHWTVERNIACVPRLLAWPAARIRDRVDELLTLLQLEPAEYRDRYPHELSGGQQQRVGVARALAADPEVLLMDEPFGALDPVTRLALQDELLRIHRMSGKTIVLVTHDIDEAMRLASRLVLLDGGRIAQAGTPLELLTRPASERVRNFIGRSDLGLRLLERQTLADHVRPGAPAGDRTLEALPADCTLREALSTMVLHGVDEMAVGEAAGPVRGHIRLTDLVRAGAWLK